MTAGRRTLFGAAAPDEPAAPGTYGEAPRGPFRLPDAARLGPVRLLVADLARSLAFYEGVLGLRRLAAADHGATLGADRPLVALEARAGVRPAAPRGRLGLYHAAYLLPGRAALGRFVRHLAALGVRAGAGDHAVSEALYLTDPDGLGVEVYADRPRGAWRRAGRELVMGTDPVDLAGLAAAAGPAPWTGAPDGTRVGHVHLHVGDLGAAGAFYGDALGFDRTVWRYPGALFLGAGGYHHHVGTNTWAGPAARAPADDEARLLEWTLELPDAGAVDALAASLAAAGHAAVWEGGSVLARDPWGTAVRARPAG